MVHIAKILKDMGYLERADAFVAYYDEWRGYLKDQDEVKFEKIVGTKEIFEAMGREKLDHKEIERIEKEYGALGFELWNMIYHSSYLSPHTHPRPYNHPKYSPEEKLLFVQINFQLAEKLLDEIKPDVIIDFAQASIVRCVLDMVAEKKGIPYLFSLTCLLKNRCFIYRRFFEKFSVIRKEYDSLLKKEDPCKDGYKYLSWFKKGEAKTVYNFHITENKKSEGVVVRFQIVKKVYDLVSLFINRFKNIYNEILLRCRAKNEPAIRYNFQLFKNCPSIRLYRKILKLCRLFYLKMFFLHETIPSGTKYVIMTLHFQPEASTSIQSPFFVDQRSVIEKVSRALPLNYKLVIKPYIIMYGCEPVSFYSFIKSLPNTIFVSPTSDTQKLIEDSQAVVTISGTSGFEAALKGKKTIVMTESVLWSMINSVDVCTDFTKLHTLLNNVESFEPNDYDLAAYLQAVHNHSYSLDKDYVWNGPYNMQDGGYKQGVNIIAKELYKAYKEEKNKK